MKINLIRLEAAKISRERAASFYDKVVLPLEFSLLALVIIAGLFFIN